MTERLVGLDIQNDESDIDQTQRQNSNLQIRVADDHRSKLLDILPLGGVEILRGRRHPMGSGHSFSYKRGRPDSPDLPAKIEFTSEGILRTPYAKLINKNNRGKKSTKRVAPV